MSTLFIVLAVLSLLAAPVLFIVFIVKKLKKQRSKPFGLTALFALLAAIVFFVIGALTDPDANCEHEFKAIEAVDATCTEAGKTVLQCTKCGYTKTQTEKATGHSMEVISQTEATSQKEGTEVSRCLICGYEESKTLAKTAPVFEAVNGTLRDWEITVNSFSYTKKVSIGAFTEYQSREGCQYCLVNLTVKNCGKESSTFLPLISFGNTPVPKITWKDYEYTRSELLLSDDKLSNESMNPLVSVTGDIAFEIPNDVISSDIAPVFTLTVGSDVFSCELAMK